MEKSRNSWKYSKDIFAKIASPECITIMCLLKQCPRRAIFKTTPDFLAALESCYEKQLCDIFLDALSSNEKYVNKSDRLDFSDILDFLDMLESTHLWRDLNAIGLLEIGILEILKQLGKIDILDRDEAKEREVSEFIIDESLINASSIKESSFRELANPENNLINRFKDPSRESVSFILTLLKPDEFTTFIDIAKLFTETNLNSALFSVRNFILSKDTLPEDAAKVVGKTDIKSGHIDLRRNFNSHYNYASRLDVIKEFYPHLKVEDGMLKLGEKPSEAKYVDIEELRKKIRAFRDR